MKSVTSFFDLHTVRKDITRFAPLWGIYLIGGILVVLTSLTGSRPYYCARIILVTLSIFSTVNMIYAGLAAVLLFGDLFNARLCNALHAMPLRRETWFVSHVVSGLAFSVIPNDIGITCLLPMLQGYGYIILLWLLGMTLQYLFFFSLATFSVFCTGNRFAAIAVYAILNSASMLAMFFVTSIYEPLIFGMRIDKDPFQLFCPVFQLTSFNDTQNFVIFGSPVSSEMLRNDEPNIVYTVKAFGPAWGYHWILAGLGVGLLVISLLLYRRRALEAAGDFIAVRPLAPVFSLIYTLTIGILFSSMGDLMIGDFSIFLLVGIIVGYFTGQMLLQRTVKIFRPMAFIKCGGILALLLVSMWLTWLDPIGITRHVPDPEQVQKVDVEIRSGSSYLTLTNEEDIQVITDAHKQIVAAGRASESGRTVSTEITYTMKNGSHIIRIYQIADNCDAYKTLKQLLCRPDLLLGYTDWQDYVNRISLIDLQPMGKLHPDQYKELLEAIKADCLAGNLIQSEIFYISTNKDYPEFKGWISLVIENELGQEYCQDLRFYTRSENIMAFLEKYNLNQ